MTASEQLWFAIGTGGFVIFFEGAINYLINKLSNGKLPSQISRVITGIVILIVAIVYLFNLPNE